MFIVKPGNNRDSMKQTPSIVRTCRCIFLCSLLVVVLVGCATTGVEHHKSTNVHGDGIMHTTDIQKVFAFIEEGELVSASRKINRLLARAPENAGLHLLNGYVYFCLYRAGDRSQAEHAETGLQLALQFDGSLHQAHELLGLLYLDLRRFDQARVQFLAAGHRHAPDNALALAHAAYYARDIPLAVWAIDQYRTMKPDDPDGRQASAIIQAAAGSDLRAQSDITALPGSYADLPRLQQRVDDWRSVFRSVRPAEATHAPVPAPRSPAIAPKQILPATVPTPTVPPGGVLSRSWSDCVQSLQQGQGSYSSYSGSSYGSAGDVSALPALPSPCEGLPLPRMVILDVMMVRTEETVSLGNGINLLTGLNLMLGYNWTNTHTTASGSEPSWTSTLSRTASLSNAANGLQYSLNIFGSGDSHAEVIARPSLIALDRVGSTFFSGSTMSVAISGQWGNSLQDKNIGVSLSVTPTFIDNDSMLLSVKLGRSYIEPIETSDFKESVSTSNNTVTANARIQFGETMVLSGLREREVTAAESGVPLLNRIPIVQYLFNRKTESDYSKHVLVMITPRKPVNVTALLSEAERHRDEMLRVGQRGSVSRKVAQDIEPYVISHQNNLRAIMAKMGLNKYYQEFKTGDLSPRRFYDTHSLRRILSDIRQILYY